MAYPSHGLLEPSINLPLDKFYLLVDYGCGGCELEGVSSVTEFEDRDTSA